MEIDPVTLEVFERKMLVTRDYVGPTIFGRYLAPTTCAQVMAMLTVGALALRVLRLTAQESELEHTITSLKEEIGEGSD